MNRCPYRGEWSKKKKRSRGGQGGRRRAALFNSDHDKARVKNENGTGDVLCCGGDRCGFKGGHGGGHKLKEKKVGLRKTKKGGVGDENW